MRGDVRSKEPALSKSSSYSSRGDQRPKGGRKRILATIVNRTVGERPTCPRVGKEKKRGARQTPIAGPEEVAAGKHRPAKGRGPKKTVCAGRGRWGPGTAGGAALCSWRPLLGEQRRKSGGCRETR